MAAAAKKPGGADVLSLLKDLSRKFQRGDADGDASAGKVAEEQRAIQARFRHVLRTLVATYFSPAKGMNSRAHCI